MAATARSPYLNTPSPVMVAAPAMTNPAGMTDAQVAALRSAFTAAAGGPAVVPEAAPVAVAAPAPGPAFGSPEAIIPNTTAAMGKSASDVSTDLAQGQYMRALGAGTLATAKFPIALAQDAIGRPLAAAAPAVANFVGGMFGGSGSATDALPAPAVAVAKPAIAPAVAVGQALAQGKTASLTAPSEQQTKLAGFVDKILSGRPSLSDLQLVAGIIPATMRQPMPARDVQVSAAAQMYGQVYQRNLAQALADAKGDVNSDAYKKSYDKHTGDYAQSLANLANVDPMKAILAQKLAEGN